MWLAVSCFSSPALSALFALLIFLIGRWSPDLKLLTETSGSAPTRAVSHALYYLLRIWPISNYINETPLMANRLWRMVAGTTAYASLLCGRHAGGGGADFNRREFQMTADKVED